MKIFGFNISRDSSAVVEGRSNVSNPDLPMTWDDLAGHGDGKGISRDRALRSSAVFRAVVLISGNVGKVPLLVYKRSENGSEKDLNHSSFRLLRRKPNNEMTAKVFKEILQANALLHGNGYAYIVRDGGGRPVELIPLLHDCTYPVREGGQLWYYTTVNDRQFKLYPDQVFHLRGLGFDGLKGMSVLRFAAESLGLAVNAQAYTDNFFKNNARPGGVLESPKGLDEEAIKLLKLGWNGNHKGVHNSHKTAVLEDGIQYKPLTINAKDAQMIETMKFSIIDVANWFSVPPHKLGDGSRTAYNSLESENQAFISDCLDNWLVTWEEEAWDKLLTTAEKKSESHYVEFLRQALVRADIKTRGEYYKTATGGAPWMTINEIRKKENLPTIADSTFDEIQLPTSVFSQANNSSENKES